MSTVDLVQSRREKIWQWLIEICTVQFCLTLAEAGQLLPTARFYEDLGWDELDLVELIMLCEEDFGLEINEEEKEELRSLQDVWDYLDRNVAEDFEFSSAD